MQLKEFKPYSTFIAICLLFAITATVSVIFYSKCTGRFDDKKTENEVSLEIILPVIEWGKYEGLSKKYTDDTIGQK